MPPLQRWLGESTGDRERERHIRISHKLLAIFYVTLQSTTGDLQIMNTPNSENCSKMDIFLCTIPYVLYLSIKKTSK